MAFTTKRIAGSYAEPDCRITRTSTRLGLGGAATTEYGRERFFQESIVKAIHCVVIVADASSSAYQAYYSPNSDPDGSSDVAIGDVWTVTNSAAGTTKTIDLSDLTATGLLTVDDNGFPQFAPGDSIYIKTNGSNGSSGRIDIGYEWQFQPTAMLN